MDRIDRIITEAINSQVNIRNVKGYRDGIARVANAISSNQQWMQNQLIADMQDWGMSIVNVYDKGNTGQTNTGNTNMGGNRTYYNNYNHNYGNGFGTSMVNGLLNDLGRAGYGELTDRIQGAVYDFKNGYNKGREQFNRWFGGNEQNQNPQNKQQQNRTQQSSGKYSKYTLMQLLGLRQQMRNNLTTQGNMIPGNASRLLSNMIGYADGMYSVLTGQLNQQSAGQMQAAGTTQGTNVTP